MADTTADGISLILPIYNQRNNLEKAISAWIYALDQLKRPYEILLIDDGSTDDTAQLALSASHSECFVFGETRWGQVRLLCHFQRKGFGACLGSGFAEARYPLVAYTGLDYDYSPFDLKKLVERIEEKEPQTGLQLHIVNGLRAREKPPKLYQVISQIWRTFLQVVLSYPAEPLAGWLGWNALLYAYWVRLLFGVRVLDVKSKFKLFRRSILDRIPIQSNGEFVHVEILAKANFLGCYMDELPIAERPGSYVSQLEPELPKHLNKKDLRRVLQQPDFNSPTRTNLLNADH